MGGGGGVEKENFTVTFESKTNNAIFIRDSLKNESINSLKLNFYKN